MSFPTVLKIEHRSSFGWGPTPAPWAPCDHGMCAHYNGPATGLNDKSHSAHVEYWKGVREFHIEDNGWMDIGYLYMVCPCGIVLEGRGAEHEQAAQPGANTTYSSCTFGIGGNERPTEAALQGWALLREWLRDTHGVGSSVKGHQDFYNTDCPGSVIYGMVRDGTLSRAPLDEDPGEDMLKTYISLAAEVDQTVPAASGGTPGRRSLTFEKEYTDVGDMHSDVSIFPEKGSASVPYTMTMEISYDGDADADLQFCKYQRDANVLEGVLRKNKAVGRGPAQCVGTVSMGGDKKYRADVVNYAPTPLVITHAYLMMTR